MDYTSTRKQSKAPAVLGCIALVVILLAGSVWLAWWGGHALWQKLLLSAGFQPGEFEQMMEDTSTKLHAPAGVHVGKRWQWRELLSARLGLIGNIAAGDFDGDGDQELLYINGFSRDNPQLSDDKSWLLEVDGNKRQAGLEFPGFVSEAVAWDMDGDGRAEILTDQSLSEYYMWMNQPVPAQYAKYNASLVVPVFSLDGNIVELLDGGASLPGPLVGDFSGGGQREIMLQYATQNGPSKLIYYQPGPRKLASLPQAQMPLPEIAADIDADGRDEVVTQDQDDLSICSYRYDLPWTKLSDWTPGSELLNAADINGDGVAELFTRDGYYDLAAKASTAFQFPAKAYQAQDPRWGIRFADVDNDGTTEIILLSGENFYFTGFYVFKLDGSCVYYEEFGQVLDDLQVVHAAGRDYVAVLLENKLQIYP